MGQDRHAGTNQGMNPSNHPTEEGQRHGMVAPNRFAVAMCAAVRERAPRVHFSDSGDMFFSVSPLPEQHAFVVHIDAEPVKLDTLRIATEHTMALLTERRAVLIAAAVTGRVSVPPNPSPQRQEATC